MDQAGLLNEYDVFRLREFHEAHFPQQPVPDIEPNHNANPRTKQEEEAGDILGYYDDGVKRTLTDDQIAMFRNSEIHRLMQERRKAAEKKEAMEHKHRTNGERTRNGRSNEKTWTKHFDEAEQSVNSLSYDDDGVASQEAMQPQSKEKKFLWPKLG